MAKFVRGQSGNPGGRPKMDPELRALARAHSAAAMETLASLMSAAETPPTARINAAIAILDRAHGKPSNAVDEQPLTEGCDCGINIKQILDSISGSTTDLPWKTEARLAQEQQD